MICVTIVLHSQFDYSSIFQTRAAGELLCPTSIVVLCLNLKTHSETSQTTIQHSSELNDFSQTRQEGAETKSTMMHLYLYLHHKFLL